MRLRLAPAVLAALVFVSCSESSVVTPTMQATPEAAASVVMSSGVRVSEIHYDNASTDVGERIEVSGPAGLDVSGWKVLLYNGADGLVYGVQHTLSGAIPATCGSRGVIVLEYATNGIQNGSPDGWAVVDAAGAVVEFMSYEGTMTALNGPANGMLSTDIGVRQAGTEALGSSLQRDAAGVWTSTNGSNTFGACNDNGATPEVGEVAEVVVTPATAVLASGSLLQVSATAHDANGSTVLGASLTWASSNPAVATVDNAGLVKGVSVGSAEITATSDNAVRGVSVVDVFDPDASGGGAVFFSEIHYDNDGADVGEGVEIEAPAGTNLSGWTVVPYNGTGGATYTPHSIALSGVVPDMCDGRGVLFVPVVLQNGSPDGVALVNGSGAVVEFISYEGVFTATGGPASGMVSVDIGVQQPANTPLGQTLQRNGNGDWYGPAPSTTGACNTAPQSPEPVAPIVINELMGDPHRAVGGASYGEWFEVHNTSDGPIDLAGWTIASGGSSQPDHVIGASVVVPAGGYAVLGRGASTALNGGITLHYNYFTGSSSTIWLDNADYLELRDAAGRVVDRVEWTSGALVKGSTRGVRDASAENLNVNGSNWGYATTTFGDGDYGTPGAPNGELANTPPAVPNSLSFSGRSPSSDPALPAGFEAQIFVTLRDGSGAAVPTTFTWSSETPHLARVDARGVMRALAAGTAVLRATAADGTTGTYSLPTTIPTAGAVAQYEGNTEFGEPTDSDPSDDFLIRRDGYTASWSSLRGTSNWVSYNLEATHFGAEDRCNCFTYDPELPRSGTYTTADYTGAGTYHGYGIDRGHLVRSFDRTTGTLDNAQTYYFSNIIPQAADLNQGPWAVMEAYLGDRARFDNREVYIIAGVAGNIGTVKDEGRIVIPEFTWKVAVILPRDRGLADVHSADDLEVVSVIMPNKPGIRGVDWRTYAVTVDAVEQLSGYDVLALLPDHIEIAVESNTRAPVAVLDAPSSALQGEAVPMSAAGSTDVDGDALTYRWSFGDGTTASGSAVTHTYAAAGTFTVRLIVADTRTLADTAVATVTVQSRAAAAQDLVRLVDALVADGWISAGIGTSLRTKTNAAAARFTAGNTAAAVNQLRALIHEVNDLERSGVLTAPDAQVLRAAAQRIIDSV